YAASARSVKGFDVYNALESCAQHLEQFGGHMYAAGLTLKEENYIAFKNAFEECVKSTITPEQMIPEIEIDAEISLTDITPKLVRILRQFEPFGPGNMTPVFRANALTDTGYGKKIGEDGCHLKLYVRQDQSVGF